jgi:hypothetical protein
VVVLKNDLDTFCKYVALRPPNIDRLVDQYCGRVDPDAQTNEEADTTEKRIAEVDQCVTAAVAQAGGALRKGAIKYSGEIMPRAER